MAALVWIYTDTKAKIALVSDQKIEETVEAANNDKHSNEDRQKTLKGFTAWTLGSVVMMLCVVMWFDLG